MSAGLTRGLPLLFGLMLCSVSWAQSASDAQALLQRVIAAGRTANYVGVFSYQARGVTGSSRITRLVDASGDHERVEQLGGSMREIVRTNDEVQRILPEARTIIIDRAAAGRYPLRLALSAKALSDVYSIRLGELTQVAKHDVQQIILEPRDDMRFAHRLWADTATGLLLKAQMLNDQGEVLEEFAFSDVNIGGSIDRAVLKPGFSPSPDWQIVNVNGVDVRPEDSDWQFKSLPPGFRQVSMSRRPLRQGEPDAFHAVFSDGLANISVFIEPQSGPRMSIQPTSALSGATSIFKLALAEHKLTVLGEVPLPTLRRVAAGVEMRRKP